MDIEAQALQQSLVTSCQVASLRLDQKAGVVAIVVVALPDGKEVPFKRVTRVTSSV